ncbi:MAG: pilus assembly protein [Chloroflexi bacterium]|nr:pilus assembly protein [Chloroflexota bacterium]
MKKPIREPGARGQAFVEFALTFPVILMVLTFVLGFAVVFYSYVTMQMAVREGTNSIVHNPRQTTTQVQDTVRGYLVTLDPGQLTVVVEPSDPSSWVSGAQVSVSGLYNVVLPVPALGTFQLRTVSVMTIE